MHLRVQCGTDGVEVLRYLAQSGLGRTILEYRKNQVIFAQGESSDVVFYIHRARIELTVLSTHVRVISTNCRFDGGRQLLRVRFFTGLFVKLFPVARLVWGHKL